LSAKRETLSFEGDTFRIIAELQEKIPSAPLIIITEPDQNGQDQLALRLGSRYVIRKPCHPVELDRLFRFILENYGDKGDCWATSPVCELTSGAKARNTNLFLDGTDKSVPFPKAEAARLKSMPFPKTQTKPTMPCSRSEERSRWARRWRIRRSWSRRTPKLSS